MIKINFLGSNLFNKNNFIENQITNINNYSKTFQNISNIYFYEIIWDDENKKIKNIKDIEIHYTKRNIFYEGEIYFIYKNSQNEKIYIKRKFPQSRFLKEEDIEIFLFESLSILLEEKERYIINKLISKLENFLREKDKHLFFFGKNLNFYNIFTLKEEIKKSLNDLDYYLSYDYIEKEIKIEYKGYNILLKLNQESDENKNEIKK